MFSMVMELFSGHYSIIYKSKLTINDLLEELRLKDIFNITDVEFATLETNGELSVLKAAPSQTPTLSDLNLPSCFIEKAP